LVFIDGVRRIGGAGFSLGFKAIDIPRRRVSAFGGGSGGGAGD